MAWRGLSVKLSVMAVEPMVINLARPPSGMDWMERACPMVREFAIKNHRAEWGRGKSNLEAVTGE